METLIPAWTYRQLWRRYERFCRTKKMDPFSGTSLAIWARGFNAQSSDGFFLAPEVEIVEEILSVAKRN